MFHERIEISIAVQEMVSALDTPGSDHGIYSLADRDAELAQRAEISGGLNRDFLAAQVDHCQRRQHSMCRAELALMVEAVQDLGQYQVAYCQLLLTREINGIADAEGELVGIPVRPFSEAPSQTCA